MTRVESPTHPSYGVLVNGSQHNTTEPFAIYNPFGGALIAQAHYATPDIIEQAITSVSAAFAITRKLPAWQRSNILKTISQSILAQREQFAHIIALEAGKPIQTARAEVDRATFTFQVASEEARRINGEIIPLDWQPGTDNRTGHIYRVPRGPITGITPFNFPLNLVAHKVAPALAVGNPIIVRPHAQTPITALMLGQIILEAGWPEQAIAVTPATIPHTRPLIEDERIRMLSFTGSPAVGWQLKTQAGHKAVTLELGGNAATIVHHDADIAYAAERIAASAFSYAGQTCISTQRVYIHADCYDQFLTEFMTHIAAHRVGDPLNEETTIGPVINAQSTERISRWLQEAQEAGAQILTGGTHTDNLWQPTVMTHVNENMKIACEEVFGPVVSLFRYAEIDTALHAANTGQFGLQAGLFTDTLSIVDQAFHTLDVGGLIINDTPSFRMDHMPYGGVRNSGSGREGVRYAMEEMSEMKLLAFNHRQQ